MEILTKQPNLKIFSGGLFVGDVSFEYKDYKVNVAKRRKVVTVEVVGEGLVDKTIGEMLYDYLDKKYNVFHIKNYMEYAVKLILSARSKIFRV